MNLSALSTLVAILDKGSFTAAADAVGCTPSAVSLQIKQLEAYFGQPLFDRSARTAKPTDFALEAGLIARELLARLGGLRARREAGISGRVRLGAIASIQTDSLPPALRLLRDRHPALDIQVSLGDSDDLQADLQAGRIDAAALVRSPSGGSSRLQWHNLYRQPFVLLAPSGMSAASPAALLHSQPWIRYDTALTGGRLAAQYVKRACARPRLAMQVQSIDAIVAMVAAGLGVSVVPLPRSAQLDAHGVQAMRLGRQGPARQIALARRKADADNRNIDAVEVVFAAVYAERAP